LPIPSSISSSADAKAEASKISGYQDARQPQGPVPLMAAFKGPPLVIKL